MVAKLEKKKEKEEERDGKKGENAKKGRLVLEKRLV